MEFSKKSCVDCPAINNDDVTTVLAAAGKLQRVRIV